MAYKTIIDPAAVGRIAANVKASDKAKAAKKIADKEAAKAKASRDSIASRWAAGDGEPTALDYVTAEAEVQRAELLAEALGRTAQQAERRAKQRDLRSAEAVAWAIQDAYGVEHVTVTDRVPETPASAKGLPAVYVVQEGATGSIGLGLLRDQVKVLWYSPARLYAPPAAREVERHLRKLGWRDPFVSDPTARQVGKVWEHASTVGVNHQGFMWGPMPVIDAYDPDKTPISGNLALPVILADEVGVAWGIRVGDIGPFWHDLFHQVQVLNTRHDGDDVTQTARIGVSIYPAHEGQLQPASGLPVEVVIQRALLALQNQLVPGWGTVHSVALSSTPIASVAQRTGFKAYADLTVCFREDWDAEDEAEPIDWEAEDMQQEQEPVDATDDWDEVDEVDEPDHDRTPDLDASERRAA